MECVGIRVLADPLCFHKCQFQISWPRGLTYRLLLSKQGAFLFLPSLWPGKLPRDFCLILSLFFPWGLGGKSREEAGLQVHLPAPHLLFMLHQGLACYFIFPSPCNVFFLLDCQEDAYLCSEHIAGITFSGKSTWATTSASASALITFSSVYCTWLYCCTYHAVLEFLFKHFFLS